MRYQSIWLNRIRKPGKQANNYIIYYLYNDTSFSPARSHQRSFLHQSSHTCHQQHSRECLECLECLPCLVLMECWKITNSPPQNHRNIASRRQARQAGRAGQPGRTHHCVDLVMIRVYCSLFPINIAIVMYILCTLEGSLSLLKNE